MATTVSFQWREHANRMAEGIANLFRRGCQVDTDVLPSTNWPGHLRVHRLVLSAFLSQIVIDDRTTTLDLNNVAECTDDVRTLIEFIYTGRLIMRRDRIEPMRRLAIALQFDDLSKILDLACAETDIKPSAEVQRNVLSSNFVTNENIERIKDDEDLDYKIYRPRINEPSRTLGHEDTKYQRKPFANLTDNNSSHGSIKLLPTPEGYKPIIQLSARDNVDLIIKHPLHSTIKGDDGNEENIWDIAISEEVEPQQPATSVQDSDACNVANIAEKVYEPFQCSHCCKTFSNNAKLSRHVRNVHKSKVAADQHSLIRKTSSPATINSDKKENPVEMVRCHLCPDSFTRESFEGHLNIEHDLTISEKNAIDDVVARGNPDPLEQNSGNHTSWQTKHNSVKPAHDVIAVNAGRNFQCQHCPKKFSNKCSLDFHVKWMHPADERNQATTTEDAASLQIVDNAEDLNDQDGVEEELGYEPSNANYYDLCSDSDSTHEEPDEPATAAEDDDCNFKMDPARDNRNAQQIVVAEVYALHSDLTDELPAVKPNSVNVEQVTVDENVPLKEISRDAQIGVADGGGGTTQAPHRCMFCSFRSDTDQSLRCHVTSDHPEIKVFQCKRCEFWTIQERRMKRHRCL